MNKAASKSRFDRLSSHAKALIATSVDDCKSSIHHYTPMSLPILRETLKYCREFPVNQTSKILLLQRTIKRLEKEAA